MSDENEPELNLEPVAPPPEPEGEPSAEMPEPGVETPSEDTPTVVISEVIEEPPPVLSPQTLAEIAAGQATLEKYATDKSVVAEDGTILSPQTLAEIQAGRETLARYAAQE